MARPEFESARELRFDGFENEQIAEFADRLRTGRGAQAAEQVQADLAEADRVVTELGGALRSAIDRLRVDWDGRAAENAHDSARRHEAQLQESRNALHAAADGISRLHQDYESVRNALPGPGEFGRPAEDLSGWPRNPFGYEHDQQAAAEHVDEQQRAARAALENYRDTALGQDTQHDPFSEPAGTAPQAAGTPADSETGSAQEDSGTAVGVSGGSAALAGSAALGVPPMMGAPMAGAPGTAARTRSSAPSAAASIAPAERQHVDRAPGGVLEPPIDTDPTPQDSGDAAQPASPFDDEQIAAPPVIGTGTLDLDEQEWEPR